MSSTLHNLRESIDNLREWLDSSHDSLNGANSSATDPIQLRQLALKYKEFLLQLKQRHSVIKSMKVSLEEMNRCSESNCSPPKEVSQSEHVKILQDIDALYTKWSSTCMKAKKEYSKLSLALQSANIRGVSPLRLSSSSCDSRHTTPDSYDELFGTSKYLNGSSPPARSINNTGSVSDQSSALDTLLESLKEEAERQVESLNNELDKLSNVHKAPPLPKPSVLGSSHRSSAHKNNQPLLSNRDKATSYKRQNSGLVNGTTEENTPLPPTQPPPKPERKKPPLKVINSCPLILPDLLPVKKSHSIVHIRPKTEMEVGQCRLAKKIEETFGLLRRAESIITPSYPCELQSEIIQGRLTGVKGVLTLLDLRVEEFSVLMKESKTVPTAPSLARPLSIATTYTPLEYACCKDSLSRVYSKALDLQTMASEEICHIELVQELILQFESETSDCHQALSGYEGVVTELRNRMLEGRMSDQPWNSARQSLDANQTCQEKLTALENLSKQLLTLEPHFSGQPIKDRIKSLKDSFQALQVDASVVIHSAVAHRLKFAEESRDIFDDWTRRVEAQLQAVHQGLLKGVAPHVKEDLCQESTEHLQTLFSTTEQLQRIQNLAAADARADIPNKEQILVVQTELEERKKKLVLLTGSIQNLSVCESPVVKQRTGEETDSMITAKRYQVDNVTTPKTKKGLVYTEIEAKKGQPGVTSMPPTLPKGLKHAAPVYTEVILPPMQMTDGKDEDLPRNGRGISGGSSSKESTPIPRSLSPSASPTRTILHSSSPTDSPSLSPSPPPRPQQLTIKENHSTKKPKPLTQLWQNDQSAEEKMNQYDVPRPHSLRTTLLQYIDEEYTAIEDGLQIDHGFRTPDLKETICLLSDNQGRRDCQEFLGKLEKLREILMSVKEDLELIQVPKDTLLSLIEEEMHKCNVLSEPITSANALLSQYNYESSLIHAALSSSPHASPSALDSTFLNSIILQLESELFDLGCLYHHCHSLLRDKVHQIDTAKQSVVNLHTDLEQLTKCLEDAKDLVAHKDSVLDVSQYLGECKEMHIKMAHFSDRRKQAASKIRELVLHSSQKHDNQPVIDLSQSQPPSHTMKLLEQLKSIETQWVSVAHSLMNMQQLEPILLKNVVTNIVKEVKELEKVYPAVECDGLKLEEISERCDLCEAKLNLTRKMQSSLQFAKKRIEQLQSLEEQSFYDHPKPVLNSLPTQGNKDSTGKASLTQHSPPNSPVKTASLDRTLSYSTKNSFLSAYADDEDESSILPLKRRRSIGGMIQYESTFDYILLTKSVLTLSGLLERAVNELNGKYMTLYQRRLILEKFWNESKNLGVWIRDTVHSIQEKSGVTENSQMILEQAVVRKKQLSELQQLAEQLLGLPSSLGDRNAVKNMADKLVRGWQALFKMLPLNMQVTIQPVNDDLMHLKHPDEFEDIGQMTEWLILMESKLQPRPLVVGNTAQIKSTLHHIEAIEKEFQLKSSEYHRFMRYGRSHDHSDSEESSGGSSPPKSVKFIDENTLERHHRKKQIKQDNILDIILSEDEMDSEDSSSNGTDSDTQSSVTVQSSKPRPVPAALSIPQTSLPLSSPPLLSPITTEETQQLTLLWNGVWASLTQRKQKAESILDIWSGFESKQTALENFVSQWEEDRMLFEGLENPRSIAAIDKELHRIKAAIEDMVLHQEKIGTLNGLTSDLIQHHKQTDSVAELQESMSKLNLRWKRVHETFLKQRPALDSVLAAWEQFSEHFHPFRTFLDDCERVLIKLDPHVADMKLIQDALDETKMVHGAMMSKSTEIGMIKQLNVKLQETMLWKKTDFSIVNEDLKKLQQKWEEVLKMADERKSLLEQACAERKDILSILSRCETWCRRATEHISRQKPLTADVSVINAKIDVHKEFERELQEKQTQLSLSLARTKHITANFTSPNSLMQGMSSEEAKLTFSTVQLKLQEISDEAAEWRKSMDTVLIVMNEFQLLSKKFHSTLSDISSCLPQVFHPQATLPGLKQQLETWQAIENSNSSLGKGLEAMVTSQKKLVEIGVQASPDAVQLAKRYHKQWNALKRSINGNIDVIKKTIWKLDPNNLEMTLPRGWTKAKTVQGTPYYIDTLSGNHTQWQHPELSELYRSFISSFKHSCYPNPAYPISLRLRSIQKCLQIEHLPTQVALETFDMYELARRPSSKLSSAEMIEIALSMFQRAASLHETEEGSDMGGFMLGRACLNVNRAVELSVSWIQDVFDLTHSGCVSALAFQIAMTCLSTTKMEDKHKALFYIASNGKTTMEAEVLRGYLEILLQIPQSMADSQYCSLSSLDASVRDCFRKYGTGDQLHSVGYLAWALGEPLPIAWLPVLHRMAAAETMEHDVKCSVCRDPTIVGFRYKCLQCQNFNMCQECYWSGRTAKEHDRSKHFMEEYCISPDEKGLFFRTLGNRGRKKPPRRTPPRDSPGPGTSSPSAMYEKERIQQIRQQLSNPIHKTSDYHSLSLSRDSSVSSSSSSSLLPLSRSENSGKNGSFSNLTSSCDDHSIQKVDFSSSKSVYSDDVQLLQTHPVRTRLPQSNSFDQNSPLRRASRTPPPVPIKSASRLQKTSAGSNNQSSAVYSRTGARPLSPLELTNIHQRNRIN